MALGWHVNTCARSSDIGILDHDLRRSLAIAGGHERRCRTTYSIDIPVIHNAKAQLHVGADYVESYRYMARIWRKRLPTSTTCGVFTTIPSVLSYPRMKVRYKALFLQSTYSTARLAAPSLVGISQPPTTPPEQALQ
ncbi:MAG: hypothetical protein P4M05_34545 [Bradyrhizobium sp.]|nr:hypothetical protein [Bradyrhizobium sp.]